MTGRTSLPAFALAFALACGPSASSETGSGSGSGDASSAGTGGTAGTGTDNGSIDTGATTDGTTSGSTVPEPCACITPRPVDFPSCDDATAFACDVPEICGHVGYSCPRPNPDFYACDIEYEYDEVALDCALAALRDRTPGVFTAGGETDECGFEGCAQHTWKIAIATADQAMRQSCNSDPLGSVSSSTALVALAPPAHFQGCLDLTSAAARYACLFEGLQEPVAICE